MSYEQLQMKSKNKPSKDFSWQQSEGILRKQEKKQFKRKPLTGYVPTNNEKDKPYEVMKLASSFGDIAIGTNKKKEILLLVSEKKQYDGETVSNGKKQVNMSHSNNVQEADYDCTTNNYNPTGSAVAYKSTIQKESTEVIKDIKESLGDAMQNTVATNLMPFVHQKKDEQKKQDLEELSRESADSKNHQMKAELDQEKKAMENRIVMKKQIENQVRESVKRSIEKVKREKTETSYWVRRTKSDRVLESSEEEKDKDKSEEEKDGELNVDAEKKD